MRSGVADFDNLHSRAYQFKYPAEDLGPFKELSFLPPGKTFVCEPGSCGEYSSSNYELLGLILAQQAGVESWADYTQSMNLPDAVLNDMPHTKFAVHGLCSNYTKVHAYSAERFPPVDVYSVSCTNGWTCVNLISNGQDAAVFVRALLGKGNRILTQEMQDEMLSLKPLTTGWSVGLEYGLGVMDLSKQIGLASGTFVGHGGETYGFNALTGYSREHDFGLSIVHNTENTRIVGRLLPKLYSAVADHVAAKEHATVLV